MQIVFNDSAFWVAYGASNVGGAILALTAWKWPRVSRYLYAALLGWACWFNISMANSAPETYTDYAYFAIAGFIVDFILGWFAQHATLVVTCIGVGQGLIALGMLFGGRWQRYAAVGAIIFFVAVLPLGIGSAFPATLLMAIGAFLLYKNASSALSVPISGNESHASNNQDHS